MQVSHSVVVIVESDFLRERTVDSLKNESTVLFQRKSTSTEILYESVAKT